MVTAFLLWMPHGGGGMCALGEIPGFEGALLSVPGVGIILILTLVSLLLYSGFPPQCLALLAMKSMILSMARMIGRSPSELGLLHRPGADAYSVRRTGSARPAPAL